MPDHADERPRRLRVGIDTGSLISDRPTGIGLFTARLIDGLADLPEPPVVERYILSGRAELPPGVRRLPYPARAAHLAWGRFDHPQPNRSFRGLDVIHGTNYIVPPTRVPAVVTVHDCSMVMHPERVDPVVRRFEAVVRRAIARGVWVAVATSYVEAQVRELFGATKVRCIPFGSPDPAPTGGAPAERPMALAVLAGRPYALAIGTREPRKNLARLVTAYGLAAASHPELGLVLAGAPGSDDPAIDQALTDLEPGARAGVLRLPYVSDADRAALLRNATLLAYPSLDEGWGFPALEAMAVGVPVLAARAGSLPEVCGDAAAFVDPLDPADMAAGLLALVTDDERRDTLVAAGRARIARYPWSATAAGYLALYHDTVADAR